MRRSLDVIAGTHSVAQKSLGKYILPKNCLKMGIQHEIVQIVQIKKLDLIWGGAGKLLLQL